MANNEELFDNDEGFLDYVEYMNQKNTEAKASNDPNVVFQSAIVSPPGAYAYYQVVIQADQMCSLREWSKRKQTTQAANTRLHHPGQTRCSWEEYLNSGTWKSKIIHMFGPEVWKQTTTAIHQQQQKQFYAKSEDMNEKKPRK